MKIIIFFCMIIVYGVECNSQILKNLGRDVKNEVDWKLRSKTRQKTSEAIDSLFTQPKKETGNQKNNQSQNTNQNSTVNATASSSSNSGGGMSTGEGFIKLSLSADRVFRGGTIVITGSSIKYGTLDEVKMIIAGPGTKETETLKLYENGSFAAGWQATEAGEFTITVSSSDGKDKQSANVTVEDLMDVNDNIEETTQAWEKLKKESDVVKQNIGQKDKQQLDQKLNEVKEKKDAALKLFRDLNKATKDFGELVKRTGSMPPNIVGNLSQLNDQMTAHSNEMKRINDAVDHQPYDNSICEYLVMVNEACAAFSTFTNFWAKSVSGVLKNIVIDKAIPKTVEVVNVNTVKAGSNPEFVAKEGSKIFATVWDDAKAFESKLGNAGIAGDVVQYITDVLLKTYCGVFKGELTHDYTIIYRNGNQVIWWQYRYTTKAAVTFRYPKSSNGSIIKMKGNIEGNATLFQFTEDVEQEDEFRELMKSRAKLIHIPLYSPLVIPFASSQNDVLGFGAVARGVTTPAYYNIPVDAEYNTDANSIQLYLNEALIDFSPAIQYVYGYIAIAAGIPLVRRVEFPVNKAKLTLNAVVSQNNELTVTKDPKNNLIVKGSGDRHIGSASAPIEHKISYTLTAKNDN